MAVLNQKDVRDLPPPVAGVVASKALADTSKKSPIKPEVKPLQDDTDVDKITGRKREGNDKATKITFFSFDANDADGSDYGGAMTNTSSSASYDVLEARASQEQEFIQEWQRSIQKAQDYWIYESEYYEDQYAFEQSLVGTPYDSYYSQPYYDRYTGFDFNDPNTQPYLDNAKLMFGEDGQINGIDDGVSCLNPSLAGGRGEAILASFSAGGPRDLTDKVDLVKSATIDADGNLMIGETCMDPNSAAGKQIIMAKAQLDAGKEPTALALAKPQTPQYDPLNEALPLTAKLDGVNTPGTSPSDSVFVATSPKLSPEQDTKFQSVMAKTAPAANAQGNDLFMVTDAMKRNNEFSILNKPTALSVSTKDSAPSLPAPEATADAEPTAPKQVSAIAGPALA